MRLKDKVALVGGVSDEVGRAIARRFVAEGARVLLCSDCAPTDTLVENVPTDGLRYHPLGSADAAAWHEAATAAHRAFGQVDILVHRIEPGEHAAGAGGFGKLAGDGLNSLHAAVQAVLPLMRQGGNGGAIVSVCPGMGTEAVIGLAAFAALTHGLHGMVRAAAVELGEDGIRVNAVRPGLIRIPGIDGAGHSGAGFGLIPLHPASGDDRAGRPEDVVNAVLFLASDEAAYITGAEFVIDGGLSQCRNSFASKTYDTGAALPW